MPIEFKLPDLGEGIHEGEIIEVLVSVGDKVEDGQPVLVVETDKATTEIPSPVTGSVKEIRVKAGDIAKVGDVLMVFDEEGARPGREETPIEKSPQEGEPPRTEDRTAEREEDVERISREAATGAPEKVGIVKETGGMASAGASKPEGTPTEGPVPATPSTRRLARELGADLHQVPPTGPGGRVTADDVRTFAQKAKLPSEAPPKKAPPKEPPMAPTLVSAPRLPDFSQWGPVEREPLRSVRRATARHMALAWSQIPHVTHQDVADITDLEDFRRKHKAEIEAQGGALSMTVFVLKAVVAALKAHPHFNSSLDVESEEIIVKRHYHLGVAVDTERGLIVPVIRDVDRKSLSELSRELRDLARRTREGKAGLDEMVGGTFTVTNIGPLGGTTFTPIINYPQVAILGMAQARLQPVVKGDANNYRVVPRLILPLVLAFDHRVVDGADAARFLAMVIEGLGNPEKLMMMI